MNIELQLDDTHTPQCYAHHMGLYCIQPQRLQLIASTIRADTEWVNKQVAGRNGGEYDSAEGVAVVRISGVLTKGASKFGTSMNAVRAALASARRDSGVKAVLLHMDTPGGTFAGTDELAQDVAALNQEKPVWVYAEDLLASAGYYVASQATWIVANNTAEIGSIGTYAVIEDLSGAAEMSGVTIHVLKTGRMKGAGVPGTEVTEEQLARFQQNIDQAQTYFSAAVQKGRGLTAAQVRDLVDDGDTYYAKDAKAKGLIDAIGRFDDVLAQMQKRAGGGRRNANRVAVALAEMEMM